MEERSYSKTLMTSARSTLHMDCRVTLRKQWKESIKEISSWMDLMIKKTFWNWIRKLIIFRLMKMKKRTMLVKLKIKRPMPSLKSMINRKENSLMKCHYQLPTEHLKLKILTKHNQISSLIHQNQMKTLQIVLVSKEKRAKNKNKRFYRK